MFLTQGCSVVKYCAENRGFSSVDRATATATDMDADTDTDTFAFAVRRRICLSIRHNATSRARAGNRCTQSIVTTLPVLLTLVTAKFSLTPLGTVLALCDRHREHPSR